MKTIFTQNARRSAAILAALAALAVFASCHKPYDYEGEDADYSVLSERDNAADTSYGTFSFTSASPKGTLYNLKDQQIELSFDKPVDAGTVKDAVSIHTIQVGDADKILPVQGKSITYEVLSVTENTVLLSADFSTVAATATSATPAATADSSSVEIFIDAAKLRAKDANGYYRLNADGDNLAGEAEDSEYAYITLAPSPKDVSGNFSFPGTNAQISSSSAHPVFSVSISGIPGSVSVCSDRTSNYNYKTYGNASSANAMLKKLFTFEYFDGTQWQEYPALGTDDKGSAGTESSNGTYTFEVTTPSSVWSNTVAHIYVRAIANIDNVRDSLPAELEGRKYGLSVSYNSNAHTTWQNNGGGDFIARAPMKVNNPTYDFALAYYSTYFDDPVGIGEIGQERRIEIPIESEFYVKDGTLVKENFAVARVVGQVAEIIYPSSISFADRVQGYDGTTPYKHSYIPRGTVITLTLPGGAYTSGSGISPNLSAEYYVGIQGVKAYTSNGGTGTTDTATEMTFYSAPTPALKSFNYGQAYLTDIKWSRWTWSNKPASGLDH